MTSRVAELARDEAERAETEAPDEPEAPESPAQPGEDEEAEEAEQEPAQPEQPPEGVTEAKVEQLWKSLDREAVRHVREVEKRAGPMFGELAPCPLCTVEGATPGFIFPVLPEPAQTNRREGIVLALGGAAPVAYEPDSEAEACPRCNALGKLQTGSKVAGQETRICPDCNGQGWKAKINAPAVFTPTVAPPPPAAPQPYAGFNGAGPDQWGRPAGAPRYGEHPSIGGW
jgi:hypothetical protein